MQNIASVNFGGCRESYRQRGIAHDSNRSGYFGAKATHFIVAQSAYWFHLRSRVTIGFPSLHEPGNTPRQVMQVSPLQSSHHEGELIFGGIEFRFTRSDAPARIHQ